MTYRYTYVGGSLFSEWVDMPALFARLGVEKMPDEEKRRQMELNVLRSNSGFVVIVRRFGQRASGCIRSPAARGSTPAAGDGCGVRR